MRKKEFFEICDRAVYGVTHDGTDYNLELYIEPDPSERYFGRLMIVLRGVFPGLSWRKIYVPQQTSGHIKEALNKARQRCEKELPAYQKWLQEWKSKQSTHTVIVCNECDLPEKLCEC